jgi:hypothetical protein
MVPTDMILGAHSSASRRALAGSGHRAQQLLAVQKPSDPSPQPTSPTCRYLHVVLLCTLQTCS